MRTDTPTVPQQRVLAYCAQMGGRAGPLGADLRSYSACLRRGWIREVEVERDFGLGLGVVMELTSNGRHALDVATGGRRDG